jgi:hypothetical protein
MDLTRAVLTHIAQPAAGAKAPVSGEALRSCRSMEAVACWFPRKETSSRFVLLSGALR